MRKSIIYSSVAVLFVLGMAGLYFTFYSNNVSYAGSSTYNAISYNTPIFINVNNASKFLSKIKEDNSAAELLTNSGLVNNIKDVSSLFDSIHQNESFQKVIKNKSLTIALNYEGKDDVRALYLMPVQGKVEEAQILQNIDHEFARAGFLKTEKTYSKVSITEYNKNAKLRISMASYKGVLMLSKASILVEEAIRQLDAKSLKENADFSRVLKTVSAQADLNIFMQHKVADRMLSFCTSTSFKPFTAQLKNYASWSELDVNIKDVGLVLSGFSLCGESEHFYSNVLAKQKVGSVNYDDILPAETSFFLGMHIADYEKYTSDYDAFLQKRNLYFQRKDELKKMESLSNVNIEGLFKTIFDAELALAAIDISPEDLKSGRVFVVKTNSGSYAQDQLKALTENYLSKRNIDKDGWEKTYEIDIDTKFIVYRFPFNNLPKVMFGQAFGGVKSNWYAVYNNYLIFSDSYRTITKLLHANVLGETIGRDMDYNRFETNMTSKSNIYFYCNTSAASNYAALMFNDDLAEIIRSNNDLRRFSKVGWQISAAGNMLYNNATLEYSDDTTVKPQTVWRSHLDAKADFKPQFVVNHNDKQNKEIVLQDQENNFYLINNVGRIQWKIKVDGTILSEIHQIDYYKNGKLQYLFNTSDKLYLVDRNGNNVSGYPVAFRAKASNGVSVFDYDNNRNYRIFVACDDKKIYAYDYAGNIVKGWNIFSTEHFVFRPLQHFRVDGKDYIVASDEMKDYILDRRGSIRVKTSSIYVHSANNTLQLEERTNNNDPRMVTTDANGNMHFTYFDGRHEEVKFTEELDGNHFFIAVNMDADPESEYIVAAKNTLTIYDHNLKAKWKKMLDYAISHEPNIYTFSSSLKKIGVVCAEANRIHLFDASGKSHSGFPLEGASEFSIGFISNDNSNFNLLVCSPDEYLYNYFVE